MLNMLGEGWGETVRYVIDDDARTERLAVLMMVAAILWHLHYMF